MSKTPNTIHQKDTCQSTTTCPCGNNADLQGFHPCTAKGKEIPHQDPDKAKYFSCGACGKVIKVAKIKVLHAKSITVASAGMCNSIGLWRLFEHARKTEPKDWCMKFLDAFFNGRANVKQREAMIRGEHLAQPSADGSITISVTTE